MLSEVVTQNFSHQAVTNDWLFGQMFDRPSSPGFVHRHSSSRRSLTTTLLHDVTLHKSALTDSQPADWIVL